MSTLLSPFYRMGAVTGVNGAALAVTTIPFDTGITLAKFIPTHAIIKRASGTLGICVIIVNASGIAFTAGQALLTLTTANWIFMPAISGPIANTGALSVQTTTASAGASTFDVEVFGTKY